MFRGTCSFTEDINRVRWMNDDAYLGHLWLRDEMREAYGKAYKLKEKEIKDMTFNDAYKLADVAYSEKFAGIKGYDWSDD